MTPPDTPSYDHEPTPEPGRPEEQTPPHPWSGPSPEAQAAAEPAREAVHDAVASIKTPEQAEQVAAEAVSAAAGQTEKELHDKGRTAADPAQAIQETAAHAAGTGKASATLLEAAKQVSQTDGELREALEIAVQAATNPEGRGERDSASTEPLDLLRSAILRRMAPHQALDVRLFLAINHLPHTSWTNRGMYFATTMMNGGFAWLLTLVVAAIVDHKRGRRALVQAIPPLWFATMTVEYPIKYYFRRRRPFVDVVQAIAVGRKPGTYSFPSGHSAAAFAGAWLLRRHYPRLTPFWFAVAALVGFSRIFVGAHYPGDVVSGALSGMTIAEATRWFLDKADDLDD